MNSGKQVFIAGAGLAGAEAAWQAASLGADVVLCDMKPGKKSPVHKSDGMAELVCSNSLRSADVTNASGLLKEEMRRMGSLIMEACDRTSVSAGGALAVDRVKFSDYVTEKIKNNPKITVIEKELTEIPKEGINVIATGPLTSSPLAESISELFGGDSLHFYDAVAPIVSFDSIDMEKAFFASRYGKGDADYINCPMNEEEYGAFYRELINSEKAPLHEIDDDGKIEVFEGCMPVEEMARRGEDTLLFGPMKPVGITDPRNGRGGFHAVVQLRAENEEKTMFNIVGFQTHLKFGEQKRVFSMIPGLENAEFLRYGVMHRNTFINSPGKLDRTYSVIKNDGIFFAGQMTGVEGYIESAASGFVAGVNAALKFRNEEKLIFPDDMMIGAMAKYVSDGKFSSFQPMNANFGIIRPLENRVKGGKKGRYEAYSARALEETDKITSKLNLLREKDADTKAD